MLSALYPDIDWQQICCVDPDLGGTLCDEYVAATQEMLTDTAAAGNWMRDRRLVKGSSCTHTSPRIRPGASPTPLVRTGTNHQDKTSNGYHRIEPEQLVFFGDRDIDRTFACAAHMAFLPMCKLIGSNNE